MKFATVRASSVAEMFDCPLRWFKKYIEGLRMPASAPARIGTAVHRSTAAYDESRIDGTDFLSIDDAADLVVETIRGDDEEVNWGGVNINRAIEIGLGCHTKYCSEIGAEMQYAAVELSLDELTIAVPLPDDRSVEITLTGTLDRIRTEAIETRNDDGVPLVRLHHGIADVKTGARAVSQKPSKHKAQLGVYELLAGQAGYEIDLPAQILALQTSSNYEAAVHTVPDAALTLLGAPGDPGLLTYMAEMLDNESFYGNASSILCDEKYCPFWQDCKFR